jgi:hypothetical protein
VAFSFSAPPVTRLLAEDNRRLAKVHTAAMRRVSDGLKEELRTQVEAAGLGTRLANTWRNDTFPSKGASLEPTAYVWSKAPKIIGAFALGATILPLAGRRYLAIPTRNVPLKARGRRMTPLEVEVFFNQDLVIRHGRAGRRLAFVNVVGARNGRGFRPATRGRVAQGREVKLVLMFVLTPLARLRKRLDPDGAAQRWADAYDGLVQAEFDAAGWGSPFA